MILRSEELSASQRLAVELLLGRKVMEAERISMLSLTGSVPSDEDRKAAGESLRELFARPRNPQPGITDEEKEAAFVEAMRSVRPSFTPVE